MKGPKAEKIEVMFDAIAPEYDKLNHLLSLDVDKSWRHRALKHIVDPSCRQSILDIACGTGDFSILIARHSHPSTRVFGLDLSAGMLAVMNEKVARIGLCDRVETTQGNSEKMDFADGSFDVVTIAFGIRNFEHRETALREILRVLKPGGRLVILELSVPSLPPIRQLYCFYFTRILPLIGGKVSGNSIAYRYLPESVLRFPGRREWMETMSSCGYIKLKHRAFSLGICRMYIGEKSL